MRVNIPSLKKNVWILTTSPKAYTTKNNKNITFLGINSYGHANYKLIYNYEMWSVLVILLKFYGYFCCCCLGMAIESNLNHLDLEFEANRASLEP